MLCLLKKVNRYFLRIKFKLFFNAKGTKVLHV